MRRHEVLTCARHSRDAGTPPSRLATREAHATFGCTSALAASLSATTSRTPPSISRKSIGAWSPSSYGRDLGAYRHPRHRHRTRMPRRDLDALPRALGPTTTTSVPAWETRVVGNELDAPRYNPFAPMRQTKDARSRDSIPSWMRSVPSGE